MVVLDEPNANLDFQGDVAFLGTIEQLKARGVTTVIVAHRPKILRSVDYILVLRPGEAPAFGPRDAILEKVTSALETPDRQTWEPA